MAPEGIFFKTKSNFDSKDFFEIENCLTIVIFFNSFFFSWMYKYI